MKSKYDLSIAVLNVINSDKKFAMNKDLNGGFGTTDSYSSTIFEKIINTVKRKSINIPVLSLASLMGIFRYREINAEYCEGTLPDKEKDIILIYGSIVDYKNENNTCRLLKKKFKNSYIGFIGPFPSIKPELFDSGDFVIIGDFEYYFLKVFNEKSQLKGKILVENKINLDELPQLYLKGFPIKKYSYYPAITKKPFFTLKSSRGCPYNCSYYCVYGKFQGSEVNIRSPKKLVEDMIYLNHNYNIKGFQFRDPTFGIKKGYIEEFCNELKKSKLNVHWGIETRLDLLDEKKIKLMYESGLRNINVGIESISLEVTKKNKRLLGDLKKQTLLIKYCENMGVKISAFYILGYESDTKESIKATLDYAIKLNTFLARFAVFTPYPGTDFFEDLKKQDKILTYDYERYTQFNLIFKHKNFDNKELQKMLSEAYRRYYFRLGYFIKILKWKIREFWL
ncbi:MAG: radical SAM protein [archaeon]